MERHRKTLLEFAEKNALTISEQNIYKEVVSGDALYARPEMLRLLKDVEAQAFDAVLCMDIDRLGRGSMAGHHSGNVQNQRHQDYDAGKNS